MYFMIKDETFFDKHLTILEYNVMKNIINIIEKKINIELMYKERYLTAEKSFNTRESFQWFYIPVILFDLVYKTYDENYYLRVILEKFVHNFFWKSIIHFLVFDALDDPPEI